METLSTSSIVLLVLSLGLALVFEFANGFHDTANAVATVIYTRALKPSHAVLFSGFCNFAGVWLGGTAVAMSIVYLLPVELLVALGSGAGLAMVFALLITAISWNVATWYLGLPASSSHTLIGSILGVGIANSLLPGHAFGLGVNWNKASEVLLSLLVSPLLGFGIAFIGIWALKRLFRLRKLFHIPVGRDRPPRTVRALLIATCGGVSIAHGSNDGQKGVGLILLILIGLLPAQFSLRPDVSALQWNAARIAAQRIDDRSQLLAPGERARAQGSIQAVQDILAQGGSEAGLSVDDRLQLRREIVGWSAALKEWPVYQGAQGRRILQSDLAPLRTLVDFAPLWVVALVALALGSGTLVGWRRIVVTLGEKIGKAHLNYAQGAVSESVAIAMIGFSSIVGLPVSTTHVLSSAITGTMVASRTGVQWATVRRILLAWFLTLPVTLFVSGALFLALHSLLQS